MQFPNPFKSAISISTKMRRQTLREEIDMSTSNHSQKHIPYGGQKDCTSMGDLLQYLMILAYSSCCVAYPVAVCRWTSINSVLICILPVKIDAVTLPVCVHPIVAAILHSIRTIHLIRWDDLNPNLAFVECIRPLCYDLPEEQKLLKLTQVALKSK